MLSTTDASFFESKYRAHDDPWCFASDPYELDRYAAILAELGDASFARGFEPGCSIGVLTERLGARCGSLLAVELSPTAAARARDRCADLPGVEVRTGRFPEVLPPAPADLVVLAEVGYYFTRDELAAATSALVARMAPDGLLVACHWTGHSADHVLAAHEVHAVIATSPALREVRRTERPGHVLQSWRRR